LVFALSDLNELIVWPKIQGDSQHEETVFLFGVLIESRTLQAVAANVINPRGTKQVISNQFGSSFLETLLSKILRDARNGAEIRRPRVFSREGHGVDITFVRTSEQLD
jgi:hypothetical protein